MENCLETLQGHGHWVASLALSQDVKKLISGSWDKTNIGSLET